jgi:hypothetical protein
MSIKPAATVAATLRRPKELTMRHLLAVAAALLSTAALAQTMPSEKDHAAHHPPGASAPAAASKAAATKAPKAARKTSADTTMQSMRDMHGKMMAAKTPEDRQALMAEHMELMQEGMAMMGKMKGGEKSDGGMSMGHEAMGMRMEMMEMMMQMMVDREAARAPAAK